METYNINNEIKKKNNTATGKANTQTTKASSPVASNTSKTTTTNTRGLNTVNINNSIVDNRKTHSISGASKQTSTSQANQPKTTQINPNQPKTTETTRRNGFASDDDYEYYLLDSKTDLTKGEARDYIKQKASENNMTSMAYMQNMRTRYKNRSDTNKVREGINNGKYSEETVADINNRYGVLLDENGNEADTERYQNDVDLVNKTATDIKKSLDKNEKDYQNGKIDYNTYANEHNRLSTMWNENASAGEKLGSYKALTGFDYYDWAKENGRDVRDFEAYVENVNDGLIERVAQEWMASWVDTANILPSTIDVLSKVIDPETETGAGKLSAQWRETANELREYAFAGATPATQWGLQCLGSLMPMINSMMIGSVLPVNAETFTNLSLGLQSGAETTRQRLEEGNGSGVALMNGILHGTITALVEALNAGQITEMVTGAPTKYLATLGLAQFANPRMISQYLLSAGVSEGAEEVIETLADYIADQTQNWIIGGLTGDRVNATELNVADMANEFIMAGVGTVLMGAPSAVGITIKTRKQYNGAMQARAHFESVLSSELSLPQEKVLAQKSIEVIDYITQPYVNQSTMSNAVELQKDVVKPAMTYDEMINNLANAINPDIQNQLSTAQQTFQKSLDLRNDLQKMLLERGINMPAEDFVNMTQKERSEFLSLGKFFNENGLESGFANIGNGLNGRNVENGVLLNTNQTRTLDIDALADLDSGKYKSMNIMGNDIFKEAGAEASATTATAHEITHFAQRSGRWNDLRDLAREMMGNKRFDRAVARLEDIYKARGEKNVNAEQEAVAFFVQKNLGNQEFLTRLTNYNSSIFNRLLTNVKSLFGSEAGAKLENTFMKAFLESKKAFDVSIKNGSVAPAMASSIGSWDNTDVDALEQAIVDELNSSKTLGSEDVTLEEVHKWVESVNSVAKMVADDIERFGYVSNNTYSAMKKNSDYKYTIDMSTLCKKRLLLQGTIDAIQRAMPNTALSSMDYITIRELMAKKGLEVSCGFCYVESARRLLGEVAEEFIQKTGADVTIADLITVDGVENLQQTNPEVYNDFVKFNNARGQQRAMLVQTRTEYRGEIRKLTERAVADLIKKGGLRLQSYSDFETPHLIDMMQVVLDMASRGLTSQAYTKVPNFADAFGNTNIKINLSLVCKGVDENGELIFDDVEGMPHEEAFRLREKYSKNVGTVLVGKDDATILSAMADPRIDYIIPFHRSGWANSEFELLGIKGYENYTNEQHEKLINARQYEITQGKNKGKLSKATRNPKGGDILPLSFWDFSKTGRQNAETYLELCRQDGRIPKFSRFLEHHGVQKVDADGNPMFVEKGKNKGQPIYEEEWWTLQTDGSTDGYWKTLIDFKMYDNDGIGSPQEKVVPLFDDEVNKRILDEYQGGHRTLRSAEDVVQEFLDSKKGKGQYSIGYNPDNPWDDYDADGDEILENLSKRMIGSKLTNGLGQLMKIYHTANALFNEFDPTGTNHYRYGNQVVNFYSTNKEVSGSYAEGSLYSEINNEEDFNKNKGNARLVKKLEDDYYHKRYQADKLLSDFEYKREGVLLSKEFNQEIVSALKNLETIIAREDKFSEVARNVAESISKDIYSALNEDQTRDFPFDIYRAMLNIYDGEIKNHWVNGSGQVVIPEEIKKALYPFDNLRETILSLEKERYEVNEKYNELQNDALEAYNKYYEASKKGNSFQYVGYGKTVNPYILNGGYGVNWNTLNNSDYHFSDDDVDMEDIAKTISRMSQGFARRHKQGRAQRMLSLVNEKNKEYMMKNPIFLANLATIYDNDILEDELSVEEVLDDLEFQLETEIDGEELNNRYNEVFDEAEKLAKQRGYEWTSLFPNGTSRTFEAEDWKQALENLGIKNLHKFRHRLETNDVVKAVLAINNHIKSMGLDYEPYDGVIFKSITDSGNGDAWDVSSDIIALFNSNQFKSVGNWNPTDSGNMFHSLGEMDEGLQANEDAVNDYDVYDYGMNNVREVGIPKKTKKGATSRSVNNMANSAWVSDEEALRMQEDAENGVYAYQKKVFKNIDKDNDIKLLENGFNKSYDWAMKGNLTVEKKSMIKLLMNDLRSKGMEGSAKYNKLAKRNQNMSTRTAQMLAYDRYWRQSTPDGQIATIQDIISNIQEQLRTRLGNATPNLDIPQDIVEEYLKEGTTEERREELRNELAQKIADQIPPSALEQLNSWRHLAMLFNPRTWIKNKLSNTAFGYVNEATRTIRSVIESIAKAYGDTHEGSIFHGMEREAGSYNPLSETDRARYKLFENDYMDNFKEDISKYSNMDIGTMIASTEFGKMIEQKRKTFSVGFLNWISEFNAKMLSDTPAMKKAYAKSMVGYFKVRNLDPSTVTEEQMEKARKFAYSEALYATFNSANFLAEQITRFERMADKAGFGIEARIAVESFIPFKRTPLNLIKTGYNYTTVGLLTNLARDFKKVKAGTMTANQLINHVAQGLTGTGLMLVGMLLSHLGLFRTRDDDEDRKKYFDQDNGEQDYALTFDGATYTIDWLDPMIIPFAMGAEIEKLVQGGQLSYENAVNVVASIADPMFETSMLSGISENLSGYEKGSAWWGQIAKNAISNYFSQYVPTVFGATTRTIDPYRRTTYPNNGDLDKFWRKNRGKLFMSNKNEPYINRSGNPEEAEDLGIGLAGRAFLNFISPGYYKTKDIDKYDEELYRLYDETGALDVLPSSTSKDVTYNKDTMKFSPEEYTEWHEVRWQTESKYVNQFIDSDAYKGMSDEDRVDTIKKIREYAQLVAKKDFLESKGYEYTDNKELAEQYPDKYVYDKQYNSATGALDSGIDLYQYYDYKNNSGKKQVEKADYLANSGLSQEQIDYLWGLEGYKKSYGAFNGGSSKSTGGKSSKKKKSTESKKKTSKKVSGKSISKGGATSYNIRTNMATPMKGAKGIDNAFLRSYASTLNRGKGSASSGANSTIVCPKCGNRVSAGTKVCPNCGTRLG